MKVMKFGGTSVGSVQRIQEVANLITDSDKKIVVLSAMSGTTNTLVEIADYLYKKNPEGANEIINQLEAKYRTVVKDLYDNEELVTKAIEANKEIFDTIRSYTKDLFTLFEEKVILAQGELMSTQMMAHYLQEKGVKAVLLPALEFMRTDKNAEPDPVYIRTHLEQQLALFPDADIYITQGYICRNAYGEIDNLQRGGSDYTASLIGAAVDADEIQIWTDIDGMHNNDPRVVDGTKPVRHLNFDEAAELAYFGAKILHPTCVQPAKYANIPVRLLNTMDPSAPGTLISNDTELAKIKAVAAKDDITAIRIKSSRMLLAHGFMRKVFEIFESHETSVDMVCTSEVGVSVTIDNTKNLNNILNDLKMYGTVTVDEDMCILCVVGDLQWQNVGFESAVVAAMRDVPVRMISYGGSNYNISFLVREADKKMALQALSNALFIGHEVKD
ncbi:MAG TPA: aspartate kinase [Bacteroidaceae bacterium]|nr:aspartate kinase [Bacteroidaceae bacterium]